MIPTETVRRIGITQNELSASIAKLQDAGQSPEVADAALNLLSRQTLENQDALKALGIKSFEIGKHND
jgi:hypothetical protein